MTARIRAARLADADGFVDAHAAASEAMLQRLFGAGMEELFPREERLEEFRQDISVASAVDGLIILVADDEGSITGLAVCAMDEGATGEVRDLHVVPDAWGTGLASRLMEAALDALRAMGATDAFLWTGEENARARRFYEREGWLADGSARPSEMGPLEVRYRRSVGAFPDA